jgi:hypothetical protein
MDACLRNVPVEHSVFILLADNRLCFSLVKLRGTAKKHFGPVNAAGSFSSSAR